MNSDILKNLDQLIETSPQAKELPPFILLELLKDKNWCIASYWTKKKQDPTEYQLVEIQSSQPSEYSKFIHTSKQTTFAERKGLPGQVYALKRSVWVPRLIEDPYFIRGPIAHECGLKSGVAFSVSFQEEILGVIELYSNQTISYQLSLDEEFKILGSKLGEAIRWLEIQKNLGPQKRHQDGITRGLNQSAIVLMTNIRGKITYLNENFCKISGYKQEEIIHKDYFLLSLGCHKSNFFEDIWTTLLKGNVWSGEICNRDKNDEFFWMQTTITPITSESGEAEFLFISFNITKQKQMEVQLQQNEKLISLGEISVNIAHEISNPLTIILENADQIPIVSTFPDKFLPKIASIKKAGERINKIMSGLKKYIRKEEQNEYSTFELSKLVQESLLLTEIKSQEHAVLVNSELKDGLYISCNETEMEQVIINLINNAIDAIKNNKEKWVKIESEEDSQFITLKITDSGTGIPDKILSKIFNPLFTTKKANEGTGLGLSITKQILDRHHATIGVSPHSPNTCFEVKFPRVDPPQMNKLLN